nr:lipopolysaccharide biosynthesis protein [Kineosphaera limosa]
MLYVLVWSMQTVVATVVSPILARLLAIPEFGSLAAAIALFQLLSLLAVFGLDHALELQRVEDRDDDTKARGLLAAGVLYAALVTLLAAATSQWWAPTLGFPSGGGIVLVTLLWTAPGAAVIMVQSLLQAEDRLLPFTIVSLFSTVGGQVFGMGLLLFVERSAIVYAWGGVIGQVLAFCLGLIWTRPRWRGIWDGPLIRSALALGIPLVFASLSQFILSAGDRFIIQRYLGESQTARYQIAFTVGNVMALILAFLNRAWLPRLKSIEDETTRWHVIGASRDGLYWLLGFAVLGVTVASPTLLRIFAPPSYDLEPLTIVVFIVALGAVPTAAAGATGRMLITMRISKPLAWAALVALVTKLVVTFALLAPLGLAGAALGTLVGIGAQALALRWAISRRYRFERSSVSSLVVLSTCIALAAGSLLLPQTPGWNIARFAFAALCLVPFFLSLRALQQGREPLRRSARAQ